MGLRQAWGLRVSLWVQACLVTTVLLGIGLHWGFIIFCLDLKAFTTAPLFAGGFQITVESQCKRGTSFLVVLLT